jgi:hypothetical protein
MKRTGKFERFHRFFAKLRVPGLCLNAFPADTPAGCSSTRRAGASMRSAAAVHPGRVAISNARQRGLQGADAGSWSRFGSFTRFAG